MPLSIIDCTRVDFVGQGPTRRRFHRVTSRDICDIKEVLAGCIDGEFAHCRMDSSPGCISLRGQAGRPVTRRQTGNRVSPLYSPGDSALCFGPSREGSRAVAAFVLLKRGRGNAARTPAAVRPGSATPETGIPWTVWLPYGTDKSG